MQNSRALYDLLECTETASLSMQQMSPWSATSVKQSFTNMLLSYYFVVLVLPKCIAQVTVREGEFGCRKHRN
ncbi:unnamed protein product [Litomosoides sigmodontis]|uniref:Uncharacterized protein n=1 Tax=Litomosoides sigmodontis TaxID=42156 RepID=A0A3P6U2D1_LITSI|nr:unnamed protein product [Litomosoides sigmodontis]